MWRRLTKHLGGMTLKAYNGTYRVPPDRHLADSIYTVAPNARGDMGLYCDVVFFSVAMSRETVRLGRYYDLGYLDDRPPNLRELYASVVAHELGHCQEGRKGEEAARRREDTTLRRLRAKSG